MHQHDSLWKTCRVLANETRLHILRRLLRGARFCVQDVAHAEGLTEVVASQHLRQLYEQGFLQLERQSKWVYYSAAQADEKYVAVYFFSILKKQLQSSAADMHKLIHLFTAFTHPRRVDIVKSLLQKDRSFNDLMQVCDISSPALRRHLDKLTNRTFITETDDLYKISSQKSELQRALLEACRNTSSSHTS